MEPSSLWKYPIKIKKDPFPPPFSFSQTGYGCGAAGTQGPQGGGLWGTPQLLDQGFPWAWELSGTFPGTGVAPGLSGYTVQPFKGC